MGTFRTSVRVAHAARPDDWRELREVMVDTGSEYNWNPATVLADLGITPVRVERFETADGSVIERNIGFALLGAGDRAIQAPSEELRHHRPALPEAPSQLDMP